MTFRCFPLLFLILSITSLDACRKKGSNDEDSSSSDEPTLTVNVAGSSRPVRVYVPEDLSHITSTLQIDEGAPLNNFDTASALSIIGSVESGGSSVNISSSGTLSEADIGRLQVSIPYVARSSLSSYLVIAYSVVTPNGTPQVGVMLEGSQGFQLNYGHLRFNLRGFGNYQPVWIQMPLDRELVVNNSAISAKSKIETSRGTAETKLWSAVLTALKTQEFDVSNQAAFEKSIGADSFSAFVTETSSRDAYLQELVTSTIATASEQICYQAPASLELLNPGQSLGLTTGGYKMTNGAPVALTLNANVYFVSYRLKNANEPLSYALVTIPSQSPSSVNAVTTDGSSYGYPVIFYAHQGTGGLAYSEIATNLGDLQSNHIVIAPVFPGEPLCREYDKGTLSCSGSNVLIPASGTASLYQNDYTNLLGLYECGRTISSLPVTIQGTPNGSSENLTLKYARVSPSGSNAAISRMSALGVNGQGAALAAWGISPVGTPCSAFVSNQTAYTACMNLRFSYGLSVRHLTYLVGFSRGGNVVNLALTRAGIINGTLSNLNGSAAYSSLIAAGLSSYNMFSCATTLGAPSTYTAGYHKILLESWIKNTSAYLQPSVRDRLDTLTPGHPQIKGTVRSIVENTSLTESLKATSIANYLKSIDGTINIPHTLGGLLNWGKTLYAVTMGETLNNSSTTPNAGATYEDAQGAMLVLHGSPDLLVHPSNGKLYSQLLTSYSQSIQNTANHSVSKPQRVPGIMVRGILLDTGTENGDSDYGHVWTSSFRSGIALEDKETLPLSTASTSSFVGQSLSGILSQWLGSQGDCRKAINSLPDATNDPAR